MPNTTAPGQHFYGFDSIRFFAASLAVFCHVELVKHYNGLPALVSEYHIYEAGKLLVSAFFVLSGYLITTLLLSEKERTGDIDIKAFYTRRALRILPLYYLMLVLIFLVFPHFQVFYIHGQTEDLQEHFSVKLIFSALLMPQMLLVKHQLTAVGGQLWTIGVEMLFYFLWPLLIRKSKNELKLAAFIVAVLIGTKLVLFTYSAYPVWSAYPRLLYDAYLVLYYNRVDCIMLGAMGAILVFQKNPVWLHLVTNARYMFVVLLITLTLFLVGLFVSPIDYFHYALCSCLLISFLAVSQHKVSQWPIGLTEKLGEITYGIYLWHYCLLFAGFWSLNNLFAEANRYSAVGNLFLYLVTYGLTYAAAFLSYRFIEGPFLKLKSAFRK